MGTNGNTVGIHPWVTWVVGFVLVGSSIAWLYAGSIAPEGLHERPAVLELRTLFERVAAWHEGAWLTGEKVEREPASAGGSLGEAPVALAFALVFFGILALSLESAWGSLLFGGFLVLVPQLSIFSYAVFYGASDDSWLWMNGVVAALLGAYAVRSVRGLPIPAWLLLPTWGVGQSLLLLDKGPGGIDPPGLMLQAIGFGFGALAAGAIWALRFEEKCARPRDEALNPVLSQALGTTAPSERSEEPPGCRSLAGDGIPMEALAPPNPPEVSETTETLGPVDPPSPGATRRLESTLPVSVMRSLRVRSARPVALDEEGIALEIEGGLKTRLAYERIEAVAAGAVGGLSQKPVLIVDLVLNWMAPHSEPLKVIRLRSDAFDPRSLVGGSETSLSALRSVLERLIERSRATPLPTRAEALGSPFTSHADIEGYARVVLASE